MAEKESNPSSNSNWSITPVTHLSAINDNDLSRILKALYPWYCASTFIACYVAMILLGTKFGVSSVFIHWTQLWLNRYLSGGVVFVLVPVMMGIFLGRTYNICKPWSPYLIAAPPPEQPQHHYWNRFNRLWQLLEASRLGVVVVLVVAFLAGCLFKLELSPVSTFSRTVMAVLVFETLFMLMKVTTHGYSSPLLNVFSLKILVLFPWNILLPLFVCAVYSPFVPAAAVIAAFVALIALVARWYSLALISVVMVAVSVLACMAFLISVAAEIKERLSPQSDPVSQRSQQRTRSDIRSHQRNTVPIVISTLFLLLILGAYVSVLLNYQGISVEADPPSPHDADADAPANMHFPGRVRALLDNDDQPMDPTQRYPICHSDFHGLNVVDLALLSSLVNYPAAQFQDLDHQHLNYSNYSWKYVHPDKASGVRFFHFQNGRGELNVIAVRGTKTQVDALQDFDLWLEALSLQVYMAIIPFSQYLLTDEIQASLVKELTFAERFLRSSDSIYYSDVIKYIEATNLNDSNTVITGHSWRGGIANIVAARTRIRSVTFSAPGVTMSRAKFDIAQPAIDRYVTNIVPHNDIVPKLDKQGGVVQFIKCSADVAACHSIVKTACELLSSCGHAAQLKSLESTIINECPKFNPTRSVR